MEREASRPGKAAVRQASVAGRATRRSIGIDDVMPRGDPGRVTGEEQAAGPGPEQLAERFAGLFRAVYLSYHRRDGPRGSLPGASRAVLEHLAMAGPLTVGEAAGHLSRAQSVVSDIVSHLERQ